MHVAGRFKHIIRTLMYGPNDIRRGQLSPFRFACCSEVMYMHVKQIVPRRRGCLIIRRPLIAVRRKTYRPKSIVWCFHYCLARL